MPSTSTDGRATRKTWGEVSCTCSMQANRPDERRGSIFAAVAKSGRFCARICSVPLFGRNQATPPTAEEQRAAEVDLERIRQGGILLGAEERLKRVAAASTPFFTSD